MHLRQKTILALSIPFLALRFAVADTAIGQRGAIATVHPLATRAGIEAMESGGNAVDAAIAAALTLGVVDNQNSGLGGGCFILIHAADGTVIAIDGRETAPAQATRTMFTDAGRRLGKKPTDLSTSGPLACGTPGALAAYARAVTDFGNLQLADLIRPAAEIAERGFVIDAHYAEILAEMADQLDNDPGCHALFLDNDGKPWNTGDRLKQPDLGRTYRMIADQGPAWFYRGELAHRIGTWMAGHGGLLAASDFADYRALVRAPIKSTYRAWTLLGMPPPSSGGIHVAQILNILENFDLQQLHADDPATCTHVIAEAMQLAFADRAHWLGDTDYVAVPRGLICKEYARQLAQQIHLERTTPVAEHGTPPGSDRDFFQQSPALPQTHPPSPNRLPSPRLRGEGLGVRHRLPSPRLRGEGLGVRHRLPSPRLRGEGLGVRGFRIGPKDNRMRRQSVLAGTDRNPMLPIPELGACIVRSESTAYEPPKHTTHIAAADAAGNWVAITATINTSFGAKVIVPGTGLVLNNEMDDFSIAPGVPNAFGLVGAEANAIAPGKRPLSSMSPTIVLDNGRPRLTVGAAGGPKIITQVVLTIVRTVDFGQSIDDAISAPRFHHQWQPTELMFEQTHHAELPWALAGKGHVIRQIRSAGVTQAIARTTRGEAFIAVADSRVPGKAAGR